MIRYMLHCVLLFLELSVLIGLCLFPVYFPFNVSTRLVHENGLSAFSLVVLGASAFIMAPMFCLGALRLRDGMASREKLIAGVTLVILFGVISLMGGVMLTVREYPEIFLSASPRSAMQRAQEFDAVKILFDANGGVCADASRITKFRSSYAGNMNLYPSEDDRYLKESGHDQFHIPSGTLHFSVANSSGNVGFHGYFCTNVVPWAAAGEPWSYFAEVIDFRGQVKDWLIGQTWSTNYNSYTQFGLGKIEGNIHTGVYCRVLKATDYDHHNYMERAVIRTDPGQSFEIRFRVSLFAGTGVNESNYHYVKPGETIACPLPVPTREGYEFDGWYDGERRVTETTKVEKRETHTLTAHWRKRQL